MVQKHNSFGIYAVWLQCAQDLSHPRRLRSRQTSARLAAALHKMDASPSNLSSLPLAAVLGSGTEVHQTGGWLLGATTRRGSAEPGVRIESMLKIVTDLLRGCQGSQEYPAPTGDLSLQACTAGEHEFIAGAPVPAKRHNSRITPPVHCSCCES